MPDCVTKNLWKVLSINVTLQDINKLWPNSANILFWNWILISKIKVLEVSIREDVKLQKNYQGAVLYVNGKKNLFYKHVPCSIQIFKV